MHFSDVGSGVSIFDTGTRDATIARVAFVINDLNLDVVASGTAKREPGDEDNVEIATLLAYGRAFEQLSQKLLKRANGLVKHQDDMKAYKQIQEKKAKKRASAANARQAKLAKKKVNATS